VLNKWCWPSINATQSGARFPVVAVQLRTYRHLHRLIKVDGANCHLNFVTIIDFISSNLIGIHANELLGGFVESSEPNRILGISKFAPNVQPGSNQSSTIASYTKTTIIDTPVARQATVLFQLLTCIIHKG
jgi:hypothetical protein